MFQRIKNFLKRFLPPPVRAFNRELGELKRFIAEQNKRQLEKENQLLTELFGLKAEQQKLIIENELLNREVDDQSTLIKQLHAQLCAYVEMVQRRPGLPVLFGTKSSPLQQCSSYSVKLGDAYRRTNRRPAISIIIPVYNVEKYLRDCLDSVLEQTLREIEVICVNDGSPDNSLAVLEEYQAKDSRITVISKENGGVSSARNLGLSFACGEYVQFMDSDDMLVPSAAEELYQCAKNNDLDVLFFTANAFFQTEILRQQFSSYETYYCVKQDFSTPRTGRRLFVDQMNCGEFRVAPCLYISRYEHLMCNQITFAEGIVHEDNLFTVQNLLEAGMAARINKPYYLRRIRENSIMTSPKSYEHFYGYFKCYIAIMAYAEQKSFENDEEKCLLRRLSSMRNELSKIYSTLDEREKEKIKNMTAMEVHWFNLLEIE